MLHQLLTVVMVVVFVFPFVVQINAAKFTCPLWFSDGAKTLLHKILDPNPKSVSTQSHLIWTWFLVDTLKHT